MAGNKGFQAEYFTNKELKGSPAFVRTEDKIEHYWQEGEALLGSIPATNFSARYTHNSRRQRMVISLLKWKEQKAIVFWLTAKRKSMPGSEIVGVRELTN